MKSMIDPTLVEGEPFEVAMGGSEITVFRLIDSRNGQGLAPDLKFINFLEVSPNKDFSLLISWNNVRDPADFTLRVLDNTNAQIHFLGPIHSKLEKMLWKGADSIQFVAKFRPSISKLQLDSELDLAKPTLATLKKDGDDFKITFERFV